MTTTTRESRGGEKECQRWEARAKSRDEESGRERAREREREGQREGERSKERRGDSPLLSLALSFYTLTTARADLPPFLQQKRIQTPATFFQPLLVYTRPHPPSLPCHLPLSISSHFLPTHRLFFPSPLDDRHSYWRRTPFDNKRRYNILHAILVFLANYFNIYLYTISLIILSMSFFNELFDNFTARKSILTI